MKWRGQGALELSSAQTCITPQEKGAKKTTKTPGHMLWCFSQQATMQGLGLFFLCFAKVKLLNKGKKIWKKSREAKQRKIQHTQAETQACKRQQTIVLLKRFLSQFFTRRSFEDLSFTAAHSLEWFMPTHDTSGLKRPHETFKWI